MRLCYALLYFDPTQVDADPRAYLARVRSAHELPRAVAARGHEVTVVHLYPFDDEIHVDGVRHSFVAAGPWSRSLGKVLARGRPAAQPRFTPARRAIGRVFESAPQIVHFFGTSLHVNLALLLRVRGGDTPAVFLHYHGGEPARGWPARLLQGYGFRRAARVVFTTAEQADTHRRAGLLDEGRVLQLMETSSRFRPAPRAAARQRTGMTGEPVFVWAARLDPLKDPLTALRGFARIAAVQPRARLYLYYLHDGLLDRLRARVADDANLVGRVHFRGRLPYERMEDVYNSADFLLQASLREHSGCAVLDAMACGTIPVVTDIPSFRVMTGGGAVGVLFPPGDDAAMAQQVLAIPPDRVAAEAAAVRARFDEHLSFPALARDLERAYQEVAG